LFLLEVEPLDLGPDVRAIGVELVEAGEEREPVRGREAAIIWARVISAVAGEDTWGLDFFNLARVRDFCEQHHVSFREESGRLIVIPSPKADTLAAIFERFQGETFGARAGGLFNQGDPGLEAELARRGIDAYHSAFPNYAFCAVCEFEEGSIVLLSERLWANEVIRRVRPALEGLDVEVFLPA
jgi:hypothetical protein